MNMVSPSQREEAVYDDVRVLRSGKHAFVILPHQSHSVSLEPSIGILMVEHIEESLHQPMSTRVHCRKVADMSKGIGTIAAPASRNLNLGQHTPTALENVYLHLRHHFLEVDSQEKPRSAATYDCRLHSFATVLGHNVLNYSE